MVRAVLSSFVLALLAGAPLAHASTGDRQSAADSSAATADPPATPPTPAANVPDISVPGGGPRTVAVGTRPQAPPVQAARVTRAIHVDGVLDEPDWQQAEPITRFIQRAPNEGAAPTERTEVRVLYDEEALYVGARLYDAHPDSIVKLLTRRDQGGARSDQFTVFLDPYGDKRSGYYFAVNAAGTLFDGTLYNDNWNDDSWDGVWEGRAHVDRDGWTVEMRIPYSQLRFNKGAEQKWGINFKRSLARGFEDDFFVCQPQNESGFVSRFPLLLGMQNVSPSRAIEIVPYATSKQSFLRHAALDPFNTGSSTKPAAGGDLRMALGKLTLNATVNPDFGQVEVDPAVVNLSDVETFFPEKRPFFVEGSSIFNAGQQGASDYWGFNFPEPTFFYSRRIGRDPQGSLPGDAAYADYPVGTTILGAAKLSGKIGDEINLGTLSAVTSKEDAPIERVDGDRTRFPVEPLTYYGVARALKEFPNRSNGLGMMTTLAARTFDDHPIGNDPRLADELNRSSLASIVDGWHFLDAHQVWVLSGWAGGSWITGDQARITALQEDQRHYLQRPDRKNWRLDPTATSLTGEGARVWINKEKGNWMSNSAIGFLTPSFDVNDLGFMSRSDIVNAHAGIGYRWTKPTKNVKQHNFIAALFGSTDFDGNVTSAGLWAKHFYWFTNNWTYQITGSVSPQTENPRRARGGPLMKNAPEYNIGMFADTDGSRKRYYYIDTMWDGQPDEPTFDWYVNPSMTYKPVSYLSFSIGPKFEQFQDGLYPMPAPDGSEAYSVADPSATNTFGRRYFFSRLDQTTLSADLRLNIAFTPRMSLQFFGQPLISSATYTHVRTMAAPNSFDFDGPGTGPWTYDRFTHAFDPDGPGGIDAYSPDFNYKSLRGNAVFRWEYMPGSAFYFVWTQLRDRSDTNGDFNFDVSTHQLVHAGADNVFLAKVTYYLSK